MARENLGVAPAAGAELIRYTDLSAIFPVGTGAWTAYTPTWTQSATITKTVNSARYMQVGKMVVVNIYLTATGSGTANNTILVTMPVSAASSAQDAAIGSVFAYDSSAPLLTNGVVTLVSSTQVALWATGNGSAMGNTGSGFAVQIASGDQVRLAVVYEAA